MHRREHGFAAIELSAGVALLLLPVALLVLSLPEWSTRQAVARLAARDAARVVALHGTCATEVAEASVARVADGAGFAAADLRLALDCPSGSPLGRAGSVTARVTVAVPAIVVPVIGSMPGWSWTAVHREPVDPYGSRP